jgi:putative addiction module component (TIGR02574 family)
MREQHRRVLANTFRKSPQGIRGGEWSNSGSVVEGEGIVAMKGPWRVKIHPDKSAHLRHLPSMSKAEILDEIQRLTPEERDEIRRKLDELDDSLTTDEWAVVDTRMEAHRRDPTSAVPIEEMKAGLRARFAR